MVAMELLPATKWVALEQLALASRQTRKTAVKKAIAYLYQEGLVHGDLRGSNIVASLSNDQEVRVIDFDRAGPAGETFYPRCWNTTTIWRPAGAEEFASLQPTHDTDMLNHLFDDSQEL
jgi:serine/threonine protein kinase